MNIARTIAAAISLVGAACGSHSEDTFDAAPRDESWEVLVDATWELEAGTEGYLCDYVTLDRDVRISALRPVSAEGTHHVVVGIADSYAAEDGVVPCDATELGDSMVFAAGIGTEGLELPAGTAFELTKGTRLVMNLHVFNPGSEVLAGTSGVEILEAAPDGDEHLLESIFAGPIDFSIPAGGELTHGGDCTFKRERTVIGLAPHMHALGTHMRVHVVRADGTEQLVHDAPYTLDDQQYSLFEDPLTVAAGERVRVTCSWENPTDDAIRFGPDATDEMCFAALLRYPATDADPLCIQ
ncbi:MAG: hypothetical protein IPM79_01430 [Polyangiaceae bacterium]|nr:hypothetical protein [Polyangiaceae bacterium]